MDTIQTFLAREKKRKAKITVIGDCMLDEYYYVTANRVSPEFPIPVMQSDVFIPHAIVPGGAGNVCMQFAHFNTDSALLSILDPEALDFLGLFPETMNVDGCAVDQSCWIPRKRRFYQGQFPLCRLDIEKKDYGMEDLSRVYQEVLENYKENKPEVVVFSDYDKGMFTQWMWWEDILNDDEVLTIVDPKKGPLKKWVGCDIFKPNKKEAEELSGLTDWREQCEFFQGELNCTAVIITQGGDGVVGVVGHRDFEYRPEVKIDAESVIGAGDCFVAFLAMTQAYAIDLMDAAGMAFEAGTVYVTNKHNKPVTKEEIRKHYGDVDFKVKTPEELACVGGKLVFTNGVFDILHSSHVELLKFARKKGDKLVVALNSDESTKRLKGDPRPIKPLQERINVIKNFEFVDYVTYFEEDTPLETIKKINPHCIVKGGDYNKKEVIGYYEVHGKVHLFPYKEGDSTSNFLKKAEDHYASGCD